MLSCCLLISIGDPAAPTRTLAPTARRRLHTSPCLECAPACHGFFMPISGASIERDQKLLQRMYPVPVRIESRRSLLTTQSPRMETVLGGRGAPLAWTRCVNRCQEQERTSRIDLGPHGKGSVAGTVGIQCAIQALCQHLLQQVRLQPPSGVSDRGEPRFVAISCTGRPGHTQKDLPCP